jgi:hypothetical protein
MTDMTKAQPFEPPRTRTRGVFCSGGAAKEREEGRKRNPQPATRNWGASS